MSIYAEGVRATRTIRRGARFSIRAIFRDCGFKGFIDDWVGDLSRFEWGERKYDRECKARKGAA